MNEKEEFYKTFPTLFEGYNIDADYYKKIWTWIEQYGIAERTAENRLWYEKAYKQGKDFDGYCEGDFEDRIKEINKWMK